MDTTGVPLAPGKGKYVVMSAVTNHRLISDEALYPPVIRVRVASFQSAYVTVLLPPLSSCAPPEPPSF